MADFISNSAISAPVRIWHRACGGVQTQPEPLNMAEFVVKSAIVIACRDGHLKRLFGQPNHKRCMSLAKLDHPRGGFSASVDRPTTSPRS